MGNSMRCLLRRKTGRQQEARVVHRQAPKLIRRNVAADIKFAGDRSHRSEIQVSIQPWKDICRRLSGSAAFMFKPLIYVGCD